MKTSQTFDPCQPLFCPLPAVTLTSPMQPSAHKTIDSISAAGEPATPSRRALFRRTQRLIDARDPRGERGSSRPSSRPGKPASKKAEERHNRSRKMELVCMHRLDAGRRPRSLCWKGWRPARRSHESMCWWVRKQPHCCELATIARRSTMQAVWPLP
jgi:hypothetical protein